MQKLSGVFSCWLYKSIDMNLSNEISDIVQVFNKSYHAEGFWRTTPHSRGSFVSAGEFIILHSLSNDEVSLGTQ